mmetsp:Transcript_43782/g.115712  ORF Transcript_43782/g.115712 Transcript_43782/m.115712 type:complete len:205 (+) Transcript_43782:685-1299(+)
MDEFRQRVDDHTALLARQGRHVDHMPGFQLQSSLVEGSQSCALHHVASGSKRTDHALEQRGHNLEVGQQQGNQHETPDGVSLICQTGSLIFNLRRIHHNSAKAGPDQCKQRPLIHRGEHVVPGAGERLRPKMELEEHYRHPQRCQLAQDWGHPRAAVHEDQHGLAQVDDDLPIVTAGSQASNEESQLNTAIFPVQIVTMDKQRR